MRSGVQMEFECITCAALRLNSFVFTTECGRGKLCTDSQKLRTVSTKKFSMSSSHAGWLSFYSSDNRPAVGIRYSSERLSNSAVLAYSFDSYIDRVTGLVPMTLSRSRGCFIHN